MFDFFISHLLKLQKMLRVLRMATKKRRIKKLARMKRNHQMMIIRKTRKVKAAAIRIKRKCYKIRKQ